MGEIYLSAILKLPSLETGDGLVRLRLGDIECLKHKTKNKTKQKTTDVIYGIYCRSSHLGGGGGGGGGLRLPLVAYVVYESFYIR